jgi:hypothetical protein
MDAVFHILCENLIGIMAKRLSEAEMKHILFFAGFASLVMGAILFRLGYINLNYEFGDTQLLVYPGTFFSLLGLVLFYRAYKNAMKTL